MNRLIRIVLASLLFFAASAVAAPRTANAQVYVAAPAPAPRPVGSVVERTTRGSMLLLGLGLVGGGLAAGGGGFAILYFCQRGTSCYDPTLEVVGWIIAAPGIIPLVVGGIMVYASLDSSGRNVSRPQPRTFALTGVGATPLPSGAMLGATFQF